MTVLEGVSSVLFAHAHPDDETLSTGALIVHLVEQGITCDVVTATRGEQGDVVPGPLSPLAGTEALVTHRESELAGALEVLGVRRHAWLGTPPARSARESRRYRDSGMVWVRPGVAGPADTSDETSFTWAAPEEPQADLVALLEAWRPDLVVSYDAHGGYGHPDHVRMHDIARAASRACGIPFAEVCQEQSDGGDATWFDLPGTRPVVARALRHYPSQLTVQPGDAEVVHCGGQREVIVTAVGLRLLRPSAPAGAHA